MEEYFADVQIERMKWEEKRERRKKVIGSLWVNVRPKSRL